MKLLRVSIIACAAALVAVAHAQTINRCVEGGKVVYSDRPCQTDRSPRQLSAPPPPTEEQLRAAEARRRSDAEAGRRADWSARVREAIRGQQIIVGMTADEVRASWGAPREVNRTLGPSGRMEQWIYGADISHRQYVHIHNGVVTSISD